MLILSIVDQKQLVTRIWPRVDGKRQRGCIALERTCQKYRQSGVWVLQVLHMLSGPKTRVPHVLEEGLITRIF